MRLRSLFLQSFRHYEQAIFEFCPGLNYIHGPNAKGKTTILEAIHCLMIGRSFRSHRHEELIRSGDFVFYLETDFFKYEVEQKLKFSYSKQNRQLFHNSTSLPSLTSLLGLVRGVVITPDDVHLIKGPPSLRRLFLDIQIAQADPLYVFHLSRFSKALQQRNQLLKSKQTATLDSWEHEIAHSASYITLKRLQTVDELQALVQTYYESLTGESAPFTLSYHSGISHAITPDLEAIKQTHLQLFNQQRTREIHVGHTLVGPHKDDFSIKLAHLEVRHYGSEGQQRSCVNALRFAEWKRLATQTDEKPLMMIDDFGLSLDANRKERFISLLSDLGQVFLTSTEKNCVDLLSIPTQFLHL